MNKEEIDYWLRTFSNNNQSFMSKDGKIITLFKVFQELKELQYLLKIKNDYIKEIEKELEEYKRLGFKHLNDKCNKLENQQKEFIDYLENEKDRLVRECSRIYVDSLGKTRLVSEDIYDEVDKILSKYKEIIDNLESGE